MNTTENLKLPQYTEDDIFDLQDINRAYDSIDNAYKEVIDFKNEMSNTNITAEVINARGGKETLGKRLDEFDSQFDTITKNKYDDVIISGNELSMKSNGVVKKTIQLPSAGETVEGHTHSNKSILDNITNNKVNNWDSAYEHSQSSHAPVNAQKNSDITKSEIEAKLVGKISSHTHDYAESNHNHDAVYSKLGHKHSKKDIADMPTKLSEFQNDIGIGNGVTPNITIGTVTTLEAGQQATVVNSGTKENPIFNFGIPKGENGSNGERGERGEQGERGANGKSVELTKTATHIKWRHTGQSEGVGWTDLVALEDIKGTFDTTTIFNELNTTNKTIIGAINELFALIKNNGSGSENTIASGIKVEPTSVNIKVNGTTDVTMLFGSDVTNKSIEYMSSNGSVARVSDLGSYKYRITGVGQGNTTIRFRTSDGKYEASCSVTVTGGSTGGNTSTSNEYTQSCTSEYILDKMYPMGQSHEAIPSGLITDTWKYNSRWENQYRPTAMAHSCGQSGCPGTGPFQALGCWSNVYRVEGTPFTQNTGVEMKDIKVYGWYNGAWELVQHLPVPNGNFYPESFGGDVNQHFADSVKQTSTSKTIILREKNKIQAMNWNTGQMQTENCMYHPFSDVKNFNTKYEYIYTCIDLRKVKWDKNGVDDRDQTHYCSNCGGDWWLAEGLMFHDSWQHNKGVCQPKMIEITKEWRRFSMTTVPQNWQYGFPK